LFLFYPSQLLATGKDSNVLMLATTTSADSTGLLDALAVELKKDKGIDLRWTAVGTGKALQWQGIAM
jgi:tungstate transport system substrate-binding protein